MVGGSLVYVLQCLFVYSCCDTLRVGGLDGQIPPTPKRILAGNGEKTNFLIERPAAVC